MGLEQLPSELHIEIFSYLQNTDLKAARAVSKKLRDNASPILFRSVVACARYLALGAFQKTCTHSVLAKYVKEIVFDGSLYDTIYAQSQDAYSARNDEMAELRMSSFWGKRTRWKRYQELYNDQEDMKASGVLLQTISRALDWITNVSCIVYSPHPHLIPFEAKEVRDLLPRGLARVSYRERLSSHNRNGTQGHPFRQLIGAIYISQYTGIRTLRVESFQQGDPGTEFTLAIFEFADPTELDAAKYVFERLESCKLRIAGIWAPGMGSDQRLANLRTLLSAATELRHLELHLKEWRSIASSLHIDVSEENHSEFVHLGLRKMWQKLRSINLEGITADYEDILDFITRHKYTLASLHLQICSLRTGYWADVVDEVVYSTRLVDFTLSLVNETQVPVIIDGTFSSAEDLEAWRYEGCLEVSQHGERNFVDTNPEKHSVFYWRTLSSDTT